MQVTNSPQFIESWLRKHVIDTGETSIGLAVQWNDRGRAGADRGRIALVQVAVGGAALIIQMAFLPTPRLPELLRSILTDTRIRKVAAAALPNALKLQKDWGVKVIGRVDAIDAAASLDYVDSESAGLPAVARAVLALDYAVPDQVSRGDWGAVSLTDMQLTCAALEAWIPLEALTYLETLRGMLTPADERSPAAALALPDAPTRVGARSARMRGTQLPPLVGLTPLAPPRPVRPAVVGEPTRVLYMPKVDVRTGGSCAHWIWRGTRVSEQHVAQYCNVEIEV
jgi:hypothetical protein